MTLLPHSHTCVFRMADASKSVAELAELLKAYIARSKKTQRQIAEEAGVPNPSYLSHMANGRVNWVESDYFRPIATALGLKTHEIAELKPDLIVTERPLTDAERRGWVLPEEEEPEIPEALQIAAEKYGHGENAGLAEREWLLELADLDFREEPETPEDWLAIYSRLSKLIKPKKGYN